MNNELQDVTKGLKRVIGLMQPAERKMLLIASAIMLVAGSLTNLPAILLGRFVDEIVAGSQTNLSVAILYIVTIIVIIFIRESLTVVRKYIIENIATQTEKKQTIRAVTKLLRSDIGYLQEQQIGSLHGRIFRSIQGLIKLIKLSFLDFLPAFFAALGAITIALVKEPLIATVMILVLPCSLFIIVKQIGSQKGIRISLLRSKEKIDGTVIETLGGIETVRTSDMSEFEVERVETVAESLRAKEIHHHLSMALFDAAKYLTEGFFYIAVVSLAVYFASKGIISQGQILVYSVLFLSITGPLREIHRVMDEAHESSIKVNDLYEILEQPDDLSLLTKESAATLPEEPIISFKNVSIAYKKQDSGTPVLRDINLSISKGEKIGIVGASGGGKSTLVKVLLRLNHSYEGTVHLLGKDLKAVTRSDIAEKIAYVPQKPFIFSGTIRENIVYGSKDATISDEAIQSAAKKSNILDEINSVLGGLDGVVSENGNNLSGGQRLRLAIARLMLQSPEILIFDEATSALDNTNEAEIQAAIEEYFHDKTIITIAHRLSTLRNSDRILVFDQGKLAQQGSFHALAAENGIFKELLSHINN